MWINKASILWCLLWKQAIEQPGFLFKLSNNQRILRDPGAPNWIRILKNGGKSFQRTSQKTSEMLLLSNYSSMTHLNACLLIIFCAQSEGSFYYAAFVIFLYRVYLQTTADLFPIPVWYLKESFLQENFSVFQRTAKVYSTSFIPSSCIINKKI